MRTVAIWSIKGGVGKTAAAVNIAHAASLGGTRTLLWDLDPQGAASFYLRVPARLEGGARIVVDHTTDLGWHARPTEWPVQWMKQPSRPTLEISDWMRSRSTVNSCGE